MLNRDACYEPDHERAAGEVIDGEAIVINLSTGAYYSLNKVGSEVWRLIEQRQPAGVMLARITASFDVAELEAAGDLETLLEQLASEGLVRETAPLPAIVLPAVAERQLYAAPRLQAYRDMQDLLALDPPAPGLSGLSWPGTGQVGTDPKSRS